MLGAMAATVMFGAFFITIVAFPLTIDDIIGCLTTEEAQNATLLLAFAFFFVPLGAVRTTRAD